MKITGRVVHLWVIHDAAGESHIHEDENNTQNHHPVTIKKAN